MKGKIHFRQSCRSEPGPLRTPGPAFAISGLQRALEEMRQERREALKMRVIGRSKIRSSHDVILIVGALIAIAMIVSKMVHNWRSLPPSLGMNSAVTLVNSRVA
jgi:hypothetical protein